ncbi:CLUMA_CG000334, isoform A [Clunio marinus]|uniref:CLUMA_CG000334, isoform A n=1 Tax=Clunio marinus TaxID=568069 RepID=A0A1J1HFF7_9DIPT|nr:CLUMA_CG000334, isoform A [Clunio marinus]
MSYRERQDTLRLQYNFHCKCAKCLDKNDEFRFNNSVLCRFCNQRLFYPDKKITGDDPYDDNEDDRDDYLLKCYDCNKVHENEAMKAFFTLLAHQSEENRPITMDQVFGNYVGAVKGLGTLDEIRFHMTEMMLHTLITNRDAIKSHNASIPLELSIELMNVKEELYGQYSLEFVEAGFFFLDVISILTDKNILSKFNDNKIDLEPMRKLNSAVDICSSNIRATIRDYIKRYCYSCVGD